jgi:hypothetical protein
MINLPSSLAKGEILTFALNKTLVTSATSDTYWSDTANIQKCIVVYKSTSGHQRKKLEFDFTQESPTTTAEWSVKARNAFEIEEIVLIDFDGGSYTIPRSSLPSGKGISFAGEGGGGGGSIVTEVVHNYMPNGAINDMATDGSNIFIGGAFTQLRFMAPYAATISSTTAENVLTDQMSGKFPQFNGAINCFVFDGPNTLFVGGNFTQMNGVARRGIAKLIRSGNGWVSDASWNELGKRELNNANANALSIYGDELYIGSGGSAAFYKDNLGVSSGIYFAAVNKNTGAKIASGFVGTGGIFANVTGAYTSAIETDETHTYFSCGFDSTAFSVCRYNRETKAIEKILSQVTFSGNSGGIYCLKVVGGDLFIGGGNLYVNGTITNDRNLLKYNKGTLQKDATFQAIISTTDQINVRVLKILTDASGNLIVGGRFLSSLGNNLAKIDKSTGAKITAFNSGNVARNNLAISSNGRGFVSDMVISGGVLYVAGKFSGQGITADPITVRNVAKVDVTTGEVDTAFLSKDSLLDFSSVDFPEHVNCLVLDSDRLILGGVFPAYGGYARQGVAKLTKDADGNWKVVDAFNTASGGTAVNTLALSGNDLYIGGTFTTWAGSARNRVAKLNATTGALDPSFGFGVFTSGLMTGQFNGVTNTVNKLVVDGTDLVIAGAFTTYSRKSSSSAAVNTSTPYWIRVNTSTNTETVPSFGAPSSIVDFDILGDSIFAGGSFTTWGGTNLGTAAGTGRLAKANKVTGALDTAFVPDFSGGIILVKATSAGIFVGTQGASINGVSGPLAAQSSGSAFLNANTGATVQQYFEPFISLSVGVIAENSTHYFISGVSTGNGFGLAKIAKTDLQIAPVVYSPQGSNAYSAIGGMVAVGGEIIVGFAATNPYFFTPKEKYLFSISESSGQLNSNI